MYIIRPNGTVETVVWKTYKDISAGVNEGSDDAFTSVPLPEGNACGYCVYVNDVGLLKGLDPNPWAEQVCEYHPLVGPAVIVSFEESQEDDLLGMIEEEARNKFLKRLNLAILAARTHAAGLNAPNN